MNARRLTTDGSRSGMGGLDRHSRDHSDDDPRKDGKLGVCDESHGSVVVGLDPLLDLLTQADHRRRWLTWLTSSSGRWLPARRE